jgi:hypothetical protein
VVGVIDPDVVVDVPGVEDDDSGDDGDSEASVTAYGGQRDGTTRDNRLAARAAWLADSGGTQGDEYTTGTANDILANIASDPADFSGDVAAAAEQYERLSDSDSEDGGREVVLPTAGGGGGGRRLPVSEEFALAALAVLAIVFLLGGVQP